MGEWMYRSTFSSPRHWLQVNGQLHVPASLPPLVRRLDGPKVGLDDLEKRKFFTLPGLELRPRRRPVAVPAHHHCYMRCETASSERTDLWYFRVGWSLVRLRTACLTGILMGAPI
jgi:hypothetical protein